jgi:murein DD-endopeptidase MepM/ murein hydrolase activator NlpD
MVEATAGCVTCLAQNSPSLSEVATHAGEIAEVAVEANTSGIQNRWGWISPVADRYCRIGSSFGMRIHPITRRRQMHTGMDLPRPRGGASQLGRPIIAPFSGTVVSAGPKGACGIFLKIRADDGTHEMGFCHLKSADVRKGARVERGQSVARIGSTGLSTGPHAHLIVYKNGQKVDPLNYYSKKQLCR